MFWYLITLWMIYYLFVFLIIKIVYLNPLKKNLKLVESQLVVYIIITNNANVLYIYSSLLFNRKYLYIYLCVHYEWTYLYYIRIRLFFFTYCPVTMIETQPTDWRISSICENDWCPGRWQQTEKWERNAREKTKK